jgi:hypothetical protein
MHKKQQVTVRMTKQFAQDLNLVMASYKLDNVSFVVQQSVAAQANAIRARIAERQAQGKPPYIEKGETHDPDCEKTYHAVGDCGPIPY